MICGLRVQKTCYNLRSLRNLDSRTFVCVKDVFTHKHLAETVEYYKSYMDKNRYKVQNVVVFPFPLSVFEFFCERIYKIDFIPSLKNRVQLSLKRHNNRKGIIFAKEVWKMKICMKDQIYVDFEKSFDNHTQLIAFCKRMEKDIANSFDEQQQSLFNFSSLAVFIDTKDWSKIGDKVLTKLLLMSSKR